MKASINTNNPFIKVIFSGIFSAAAAFLIILIFWQFELRSISLFIRLAAPAAVVIWTGAYFLYFRRSEILFDLPFSQIALGVITSLIISLHLIPPQTSLFRYILTLILTILSLFVVNQIFLMTLIKILPWKKVLTSVTILMSALNLAVIVYDAQFVRIYADDFANVLKLEQFGVWGAAMLFYRTWSGRFFTNFILMEFSNKTWAPLAFLILIQGVLVMVMRIFLGRGSLVKALAASLLIPLAIYAITPDMYKSLFWNASAMVLLPLLLMIPVYLLLAYHIGIKGSLNPVWLIITGGFLSFAITTSHECAAIGWAGMHLAVLLWFLLTRQKNKNLRGFILAGLLASFAGLAVMVFSPGAATRYAEQEYSTNNNIPAILLNTVGHFIKFFKDISRPIYPYHGFIRSGWLLLVGLFGFAWSINSPFNKSYRTAFLVLALSLAMVLAAFLPGSLILSDTIPLRTQFIPTMYLVFGFFIFGLLLPGPSSQQLRTTVLYLLTVIILTGSAINLVQLSRTVEPMRQYAQDWDARDELVLTTDELPHRLKVPWDEYEQNLGDFRKYYRSIKGTN